MRYAGDRTTIWQNHMTRRFWMLTVLASIACSHPPRSSERLLPRQVAEVWTRTSLHDIPPSPARARRAFEATYEGAGKLTADVYELNSSAEGLDMVQRWKPAPDTVFFYKDNYFAVVKWSQADRQALTAFVRALEKGLGA
jgi:hypothetical protein